MKLICRYSGIEWEVRNCFGDIRNSGKQSFVQTHPVFHLPVHALLSQMGRWSASSDPNNKNPMNADEKKLLFLALLFSTGLLEWRIEQPVTVDVDTCDKYMEKLARFMVFFEAVQAPERVFPRLAITYTTRQLKEVGTWIESWEAALASWKEGYETARVLQKLEARERALERLIKSPLTKNAGDETRYSNQLAEWALTVTRAPENIKEYWRSLFNLRGIDIYTTRTADLEELQEWLLEHLPPESQGTIYSNAVMTRINMLLAINRKGFNMGLGIPEAVDIDEFEAAQAAPFKFLPDDPVEDHNAALQAINAPPKKPLISDYATKFEYLRAQAKFVLAEKQLNKILLAEMREIQLSREDDLQKIEAEEAEDEPDTISMKDI